MSALRAFFSQHRLLALWLVALTLCVKAAVPAGFMVDTQAHGFAIEICDGQGGHMMEQMVMPATKGSAETSHAGKSDQVCPFSALTLAMLGGADVVLLALALVFIMALGLARQTPPAPRRAPFLRPPSRGPPVLI